MINKIKGWFQFHILGKDICPKCNTLMNCEGYYVLNCPKCKNQIVLDKDGYGNRAYEGRDNE